MGRSRPPRLPSHLLLHRPPVPPAITAPCPPRRNSGASPSRVGLRNCSQWNRSPGFASRLRTPILSPAQQQGGRARALQTRARKAGPPGNLQGPGSCSVHTEASLKSHCQERGPQRLTTSPRWGDLPGGNNLLPFSSYKYTTAALCPRGPALPVSWRGTQTWSTPCPEPPLPGWGSPRQGARGCSGPDEGKRARPVVSKHFLRLSHTGG